MVAAGAAAGRRVAWFLRVLPLLLGGHAQAQFACQDPWGTVYRLPLAHPGLSCHAVRVTPPDPPGVESAVEGSVEAAGGALALAPAPAPAGTHNTGRLLMQAQRSIYATAGGGPSSSQREAFEPLILSAAARYGHDASLLKAIVHVESRFNAAAVSAKGAIGLMQLMPATARELGVSEPATKLFDPAVNLDAGARLLRQLLNRFADRPDLAIAAYNAGTGAVLKHGREIPLYPETQAYVRDVAAEFARLNR